MTNPFVWSEILLYVVPILAIIFMQRFFRRLIHSFPFFPLNSAIVLIPLWLVLIHLFSLLIFSFSLVPFIIFITAFMLGLHLYEYIRRIDEFKIRSYYLQASRVIFSALSCFLIGLAFLRLFTYFI